MYSTQLLQRLSLIIALILLSSKVNAQTADQLIRLNNVANTTDMNNISSPHEGSLVYAESHNNLFLRTSNSWNTVWSNQGNTASDSYFIGTISNHDFRIRTNDSLRMIVKNDGDIIVNDTISHGIFTVRASLEERDIFNSAHGQMSSDIPGSGWTLLVDGNNSNTGAFQQTKHIMLNAAVKSIVTAVEIYSAYSNALPFVVEARTSNSSSWVIIHSFNGPTTAWGFRDDFTNTTQYEDYRIRCTGTNSNSWASYREINLIGKIMPPDFVVAQNGSVGIGINPNPNQKLHVNGNTRIEGNIFVTGTITPDYVFENYFDGKSKLNPEYEFTPLEKAEHFVKKNKHLPGVPSAADIEKQGGIIVNRATEINLEKIE